MTVHVEFTTPRAGRAGSATMTVDDPPTRTVGPMPDEGFEHPRLTALYDVFEGDRVDLVEYLDIVEEVGGRSVLDLGCGTGTLALLLAGRGIEVFGVDPAG